MSTKRPISIFVLIDALGWRYVQGRPFLNHMLTYRRPLRTILGFSSGAIPTILTGLPPATTGHWNLFYYDPKESPFQWMRFARFLPKNVLNHRLTRRLVTELGRRVLGMGPGFECCLSPHLLPWFNWVERKSIYRIGGIENAYSILDQLQNEGTPFRVYSYHEASDTEILRGAEADLVRTDAVFFFIYLCEMDMFLHQHCQEPARIDEELKWYEHRSQKIFEIARRLVPAARLTVTSGPGMTPVEKTYDLLGRLEPLGLKMPEDYLAVFDSTMARFWFFDESAREKVGCALDNLECGRWLDTSQLKREGVFFEDQRFGERIFLLNPGWLLSRSDFNGVGWTPSGMHGYHPDDPSSDAIFLSSHAPPFEVKTISDVYPRMREAARRSVVSQSEKAV